MPGQRRLLASTCGVGQRTLAALSRGARPNLFNRLRGCAKVARETARDAGLSYGVTALLLLVGEADSTAAGDTEAAAADHLALLRRLREDVAADIATGIAEQAEPPVMLLCQTGGVHATETNAIAQAQLDWALGTPGCLLVAPVYPLPERGGCLDSNGYRWLGGYVGKVLHRVLDLGEPWLPLHPLRAELLGKEVRATFHVPVPPLQWGQPIANNGFVEPQQRGFTVLDAAGPIAITGVALDGPDAVVITLGRAPQGPAVLRYADRRHAGRGALHDSDPALAPDSYTPDPTAGHAAKANLARLVGKPYPLVNWCVAFAVPLTLAVPPRPPETKVWAILNDITRPPPPPPRGPWRWLRFWRR
jgi:hypothetical protein